MSVDRFRDDPLYPRIARAVEQILARGEVVAPVDVLVGMNLLAPERLEDWRRGRVPYLEKVVGETRTLPQGREGGYARKPPADGGAKGT